MIELSLAYEDFCLGGINEWVRFVNRDEYVRLCELCDNISCLEIDGIRAPHNGWDFDSQHGPDDYKIQHENIRDTIQNFLITTDIKATFHYRWKRDFAAPYPEPFQLYAVFDTEEDAMIFKFKFS